MDFGSKFVYVYDDSEEESLSDSDDNQGPHTPDSPVDAGECSSAKRSPGASSSAAAASKKRIKCRKADTNVVTVKLDHLVDPCNMHTGDLVSCNKCHALLSHISKVQVVDTRKVWTCEFCSNEVVVDIDNEEIPQRSDVTYMLEPAPSRTDSMQPMSQSVIVFCIDISGSMGVSKEIPGRVRLRGDHSSRNAHLYSDRNTVQRQQNVTYITRLQAVQAAVEHQLEQLKSDHPNQRVMLVTFNSEVTVVGDGSTFPLHITGDKLNDVEELSNTATTLALPGTVEQSKDVLTQKLFQLEEGGMTALGPALLVSVKVACRHPGSKVVLCTDGLANVGLGTLDEHNGKNASEASELFYENVAQEAKKHGVIVSVTTIKGTDCKLIQLGHVTDVTGGQVNIVDPLKLTTEFGNILAESVIARNVVATFLVHSKLYIRDDNDVKQDKLLKDIGNVTRETEIGFEYGIRKAKQQKEGTEQKETDDKALNEVPFQVQIVYIDVSGIKAMRVITELRPITKNRSQAEKEANVQLIGYYHAQQMTAGALTGQAKRYQRKNHTVDNMFLRNEAVYEVDQLADIRQHQTHMKEVSLAVQDMGQAAGSSSMAKGGRGQLPSKCSDKTANKLYNFKNLSKSKMFSRLKKPSKSQDSDDSD